MQGLVLDCSALEWQLMDQFPPAEEAAASSKRLPIWLALDEVEDPVSSCCPRLSITQSLTGCTSRARTYLRKRCALMHVGILASVVGNTLTIDHLF